MPECSEFEILCQNMAESTTKIIASTWYPLWIFNIFARKSFAVENCKWASERCSRNEKNHPGLQKLYYFFKYRNEQNLALHAKKSKFVLEDTHEVQKPLQNELWHTPWVEIKKILVVKFREFYSDRHNLPGNMYDWMLGWKSLVRTPVFW